MPGTLFVVATPIGNLEDLSFRALRILREVRLIAAEDTRRTAKLLAHYEIRCSMVSLREHNESREAPRLLARLAKGESIALVTDAGTPGISDPGTRLVRGAHERNLPVVPIPGPSAVATALSASGFPADRFVFMGFPPSLGQARDRWFDEVTTESKTVVFFESPHRIERTLAELREMVKRPIFIARELTKLNEQLVNSPNTPLTQKGEFTVVVGERSQAVEVPELDDFSAGKVEDAVGYLTNIVALDESKSIQLAAFAFNTSASRIRKVLKRRRYARHQADDEG